MRPYQILPFTNENLAKALSSKIPEGRILDRAQFLYLKNYLGSTDGINAKTIVVELDYVSKAYITDYSNYYATCFQEYERMCKRVHFFNVEFNDERLRKELLSESEFLNNHYLGYIVVKPLPDSVIGPTLLATYGKRENDHQRFFPACKVYHVNFFGKTLAVQSLAYQEQDTVVSACASVAIWSAFHKTSSLFKTALPSPGEITKLAGNLFFNYGRIYPNHGLDLTQVCRAIDAIGLVSEVRSSKRFDGEIFLASRIIYAYLKCGIPILLLIKSSSAPGVSVGHAVTIIGYSKPKPKASNPSKEITLIADGIDKFYVHDDQLGPFASYEFSGKTALKTHHWNSSGEKNYLSYWIHAVVIPVYPKIRVGFEDVFDRVDNFDRTFFEFDIFNVELEWDVYLEESNKYKGDLLKSNLDEDLKIKKVTANYPRYIWVAKAQIQGHVFLDLIFDSTDIPSGRCCLDLIVHDIAVAPLLMQVMTEYPKIFTDEIEGPNLDKKIYEGIINDLSGLIKKPN
ncbi:MAG TPA: hypothetical protein PKL56_16080 [Cyclobacteriaceae bacterium]|nr:hypothetical protein [Cyclobacteriaceae bacterium]HMX88055.1 hypothetical protein [Saprospiraceae bacterium]HMX00888.1 hypothetical protein [Cyclobacteriaceae bacterium]HMY93692.1 hypothetical protein [Cyclobacteriaceae bacterium]HNA12874.1 hypothetical protein [Cyclobacteriaceae bacterium]